MQQSIINSFDLKKILSCIQQYNEIQPSRKDTIKDRRSIIENDTFGTDGSYNPQNNFDLFFNEVDEFFGLMVLCPAISNKVYNSNTPLGSVSQSTTPKGVFCIKRRSLINYKNSNNLERAQKIWSSGLVPIQIVQDSGLSTFFSLPKLCFQHNHFIGFKLKYSEETVPNLRDFF